MKTVILRNKEVEPQRNQLTCPAGRLILKPTLPAGKPHSNHHPKRLHCIRCRKTLILEAKEEMLKGNNRVISGGFFPGGGHPGPLSCPLVFLLRLSRNFPPHHTLNAFYPLSGMFLIFTDPACDEQRQKRWKKPMVTAPSEGGYPAHNNSTSQNASTPLEKGPQHLLGTFIYSDLSYSHNSLETQN